MYLVWFITTFYLLTYILTFALAIVSVVQLSRTCFFRSFYPSNPAPNRIWTLLLGIGPYMRQSWYDYVRKTDLVRPCGVWDVYLRLDGLSCVVWRQRDNRNFGGTTTRSLLSRSVLATTLLTVGSEAPFNRRDGCFHRNDWDANMEHLGCKSSFALASWNIDMRFISIWHSHWAVSTSEQCKTSVWFLDSA